MTVPLWAWAGTLAIFAVLIAADLAFTRGTGGTGLRGAAVLSGLWIAAGLAFGGALWLWQGSDIAGQYFGGYLLEKALSVDNILVFVLLFASLAVPVPLQRQVLYLGVVGALVLRGGLIAAGGALIDHVGWIFYVFGALVLLAGVRMFRPGEIADPGRNLTVRGLRRLLPVTDRYAGGSFFVRRGGRTMATPLLVALIAIETTDLVFALDSIPAVFGITRNLFVVFTSNAFAVLGLRALYFLLAGSMDRFCLPQARARGAAGVHRHEDAPQPHCPRTPLSEPGRHHGRRGSGGRRQLIARPRPAPPGGSAAGADAPVSVLTSLQVDSVLSYAIAIVIPALDAIFPVVPSETAIIALGVATAGSADPRIALLVACAALGAFLGDNLSYLLGRRFGPLVERRFFASEKGTRRRAWAEHSLQRFGMPLIIVCRFIPGGRTAVTLSCGLIGYQRRRFVIATAVAAVIWALYAFFAGRLGGKAFEDKPWAGLLVAFGGTVVLSALIEAARRIRSRWKGRTGRA